MGNPIFYIARFFIKRAVSHYKLSSVVLSVFVNLLTISISTIRVIGFVPVYRVLRALPVLYRTSPAVFKRIEYLVGALQQYRPRGIPLNSAVISAIFSIFNDSKIWKDCMILPDLFIKVYKLAFLPSILFGGFFPVARFLIKWLVGLIFTALGIIFNDQLSSIPLFKEFAFSIISFMDNYLPLHFLSYSSPIESDSLEDLEIGSEASSKIYILGILLVGLVTTLGLLVVTDLYYPDFLSSVPYLNSIVHSTHDLFSNISTTISSWWNFDDGSSTITSGDNLSDSTSPAPSTVYNTPETSFSELPGDAVVETTIPPFPDEFVSNWSN